MNRFLGTSLLDVPPGREVVIRHILFEVLREECARRGIRAGEAVRVLARERSDVALAVQEGRTVRLPRKWGEFIEACPPSATPS